ncbi:hypothetical protein ACSYDW_07185 [Paeniglutamicibacter sp. R2-26]|uniref:hypothetical protein n=1 Tax=Paeniglutamicibacter sp. R2-26 TaxID=3144417 RepID=UPI003EE7D66A
MTPEELRACIVYANGIDPRIQMTAPNAQLWGRVVGDKTALEVTVATQVYYERPRLNGREHPPIDPATIKRIIFDEDNRAQAMANAQTAIPFKRPTGTWRDRNPGLWDQLYAKGRDEHRADLQRRGIPLQPHQQPPAVFTIPKPAGADLSAQQDAA